MVKCNISLDDQQHRKYYAGETLRGTLQSNVSDRSRPFLIFHFSKGTIELKLKETRMFRGLSFIVYGAAYCHWLERKHETRIIGIVNKKTNFERKEIYLNSKTYLFGSQSANLVDVKSGTHRYSFECQLPYSLPPSIETNRGNVRYWVEAVLDVPWKIDKKYKLNFKVFRHEDLNKYPELKMPCERKEVKRFGWMFLNTEPLTMDVSLPFSGYTPGANIHVTVNYKNKSKIEVETTKFYLKKITRYTSSQPYLSTKTEARRVAEIFSGGVKGLSDATIEQLLKIPQLISYKYCKAIQISYELKVEAVTKFGLFGSLTISIPITIGSIPLDTDPSSIASFPIANMNRVLPPSYDEVIKMDNQVLTTP